MSTFQISYLDWLPSTGNLDAIHVDADCGYAEKGEVSSWRENSGFIVRRKMSTLEHKFVAGSWIAFLTLMILAMILLLTNAS